MVAVVARGRLAKDVTLAVGLAALLAALGCALAIRRGVLRPSHHRPPSHGPGAYVVALAALAVANAELLFALVQRPFVLSGDLRSHAMVAREIALGRASDGWVDVFHGGFPLGPHYPPLAWLVSALAMRLGASPEAAVTFVGVGAVLLTEWLLFHLALRSGASLPAALAGALASSAIVPFTSFVGGAQAILFLGLLSQVCVVPLLLLAAWATLLGRSSTWLALAWTAAVLAHPQVSLAAIVALAPAAILSGRRARRRLLLGACVSAITLVGVYGPGLSTMHVPFGWPKMERWRVEGYPPTVFAELLASGELLDAGRAPLVTAIASASFVAVVFSLGRRASRVALGVTAAALSLASSGAVLSRLGQVGAMALSFLQPLRAYALLPICVALITVVAVDVVGTLVPRRARPIPGALLAVVILAFAGPAAVTTWRERGASIAGGACGPMTPKDHDEEALERVLSSLDEGRLAYLDEEVRDCADVTHLDFSSSAPIAAPFAAGAHVGVMAAAFHSFDPRANGAATLADALAIHSVLHRSGDRLEPASAWQVRAQVGDFTVSERTRPTSYFALGCVMETWRGSDRALRARVLDAIDSRDVALYGPRLIALETSDDERVVSAPGAGACGASAAAITSSRRVRAGDYEADVASEGEVDLVLRETAYRTWQFDVDGAPEHAFTVAPGFLGVRLHAGTHHVRAHVRRDTGYLLGVLASIVLSLVAARLSRRWASR